MGCSKIYEVDLKNSKSNVISGHIKMGGKDNKGNSIQVNSLYLTFDNKAVLPVMGEFHFSRYNHNYWRESILKMKAAGINIISTYIFWIHHEEIQGKYDWEGNRNLRAFLKLCKETGMKVILRVGPWCHGECRNGGFPDWILKKCNLRTNDETYLKYVKILFQEIYNQSEGLFYKDGGPVIGIQVENEYDGPGEHLMALKNLMLKIGFDVPLYTATAWGCGGYSDIPEYEMLPMFGGYPDAPWAKHINKLEPSENYTFNQVKNDEQIGCDLHNCKKAKGVLNTALYPYATCELGAGVQVTKHRRPIISSDDVVSAAFVRVGSGVNLLGYYMFHGGSNPTGKLTTLNETKDSGYPNDLPVVSYDFQAPIREFGQINDSYKGYKLLHTFLNDFGGYVALTKSVFPLDKPKSPKDADVLRYAVRVKDNSGFIFINNYQRYVEMKDLENIKIKLKFKEDELLIPRGDLKVNRDKYFIMPFNLNLGGSNLVYSTTQPICKLDRENEVVYFFFNPKGVEAEYVFDNTINNISGKECNINKEENTVYINKIQAGLNSSFSFVSKDKKSIKIITITEKQAYNLWKVNLKGTDTVIITDSNLICDEEKLEIYGYNSNTEMYVYGKANYKFMDSNVKVNNTSGGEFTKYDIEFNKQCINSSLPWLVEQSKEGATWKLNIEENLLENLKDVIIRIHYNGESGKLYNGDKLLSDNFYNGTPWEISLKHLAKDTLGKTVVLKIDSLCKDDWIYLEKWPQLKDGYVCELSKVEFIPEYNLVIEVQ